MQKKLSRSERKQAADKKRKYYNTFLQLVFWKSVNTIQEDYNCVYTHAFKKALARWDFLVNLFCKKEYENAHIIRSVQSEAKKQILQDMDKLLS